MTEVVLRSDGLPLEGSYFAEIVYLLSFSHKMTSSADGALPTTSSVANGSSHGSSSAGQNGNAAPTIVHPAPTDPAEIQSLAKKYIDSLSPFYYKDTKFHASSADTDLRRGANAWRRDTAFQRPFHWMFVVMWATWITTTTVFFGISGWFISPANVRNGLFAMFAVLHAVHLWFVVRVGTKDNEDTKVKAEAKPRDLDFVKQRGVPVIYEGICGICQSET